MVVFERLFAMVVYDHWYDRLLEPGLWIFLLFIASVIALGWQMLRNFPLRGQYFSGVFVLALCPFLCFSLLGMIHTEQWRTVDNSDQKLSEVVGFELYGLAVSLLELAVYSLVYLAGRKRLSTPPVLSSIP